MGEQGLEGRGRSRLRMRAMAAAACVVTSLLLGSVGWAQAPSAEGYRIPGHATAEPIGGQPPAGAVPSSPDLGFELMRQRAFEAILYYMPALAIHRFRAGPDQALGMADNVIATYSQTATPALEALTANASTPYISAFTDLREGPVVLEVPAAGADGTLYGQVVDAWQTAIADIGPSGLDRGRGARYLFTPPEYAGSIPEGFLHVPSSTYRISLAFRSIVASGKTPRDAFEYARRLRMYSLSEAGDPPPQEFVDPSGDRVSTLPLYDERAFEDLHEIVSVEPVREGERTMRGMLKSLGIERGKPFEPDEKTTRAMRQGAVDAWYFLQDWYDNVPQEMLFWPDRHYMSLIVPDENRRFTYEYRDHIDLIPRAARYFMGTYFPKELSETPATEYLAALADAAGKPLVAGQTYQLTIPPDMPVEQFWALTVYDRNTFSFIYTPSGRTTLSSYDMDAMVKNADGSVTIFIGPEAPGGAESNWIDTAGKRPLPTVRFYGPTEELHQRRFKLGDVERVD